MPLTTAARNILLGAVPGTWYLTAFTDVGVTEVASITRVAVTWAAPAGGSVAHSGTLSLTIPTGNTVQTIGLYSAITAGTQEAFFPIGATAKYGAATILASSDVITAYANGLANDDRVFVTGIDGGAVPTGMAAGTLYYVVNVATDTFQLSATSGGAAVNATTNGAVQWYRTVPQAFPSGGTLQLTTGNLVIDLTAL
jgi:hypothetical protein